MGLFDLFRKKDSAVSGDRELLRLKKMVSNKLSQNIDRQDALHRLSAMATPAAAEILLTRFSWNLDPSITDQEEKSVAMNGLAAAGDAALEPIRNYCARAEGITWPLKALRRIVPAEQLAEELLVLLDEFDTEYMRNPEPKAQLVQALEEFASEDVRIAVEPFLTDMSEQVRFAAVATVFASNDQASVDALAVALTEDESMRVKNRIATGLVKRSWSVPEALRGGLVDELPPGFELSAEGRLTGASAS